MSKNDFLTIQEFIQKYEVADIRIRRRIRKYKLTDPQKLEGNLSEKYEKGVGNIILLKESFWVKELEVSATETEEETAYAVPLKRSPDRLSGLTENDQNRLSGPAYAPGQVTVDQEFLDILKEDRAEKKEWVKKYDSLLVDYKDKDNQLAEREKFLQGLIEKIIEDARNTKHLLMSQINHLQKQLQVPKKGQPIQTGEPDQDEEFKFENGNFTENKEAEDSQDEDNQKEGD